MISLSVVLHWVKHIERQMEGEAMRREHRLPQREDDGGSELLNVLQANPDLSILVGRPPNCRY
jgi:hypothetical protein